VTEKVTLTISPEALEQIGYGDSSLLFYIAPNSCFVNSIQAMPDFLLANLYIRTDSSHVLIRSWKDWGFGGLRLQPGHVLELEVVWMADTPPSNPRAAIIEMGETLKPPPSSRIGSQPGTRSFSARLTRRATWS
jgi:hypothetical protein